MEKKSPCFIRLQETLTLNMIKILFHWISDVSLFIYIAPAHQEQQIEAQTSICGGHVIDIERAVGQARKSQFNSNLTKIPLLKLWP
jgi:hypothetical protein